MQPKNRLALLAVLLGASRAAAQAPIYLDLSAGSTPTDVVVVPATPGNPADVIVVGTDGSGSVFTWRYTAPTEVSLNVVANGGNTRVSADGTKITTTLLGADGFTHAARYDGVAWTLGPGLGAQSGTSESSAYAISGDGNVVAGSAWVSGGNTHAAQWSYPSNTITNLGGPFSDPSSRLNAANGDGSVLAGWKNLLNGMRVGAYWVNGVLQPQFTMGPLFLGEALAADTSGTRFVGVTIFGASGSNATAGWRWDSGVVTALPNLAAATTRAVPMDLSDDGARIVGHTGGNLFTGTSSLIWLANTPVSLHAHLAGLGTTGIASYTDLGMPTAISANGLAICGRGSLFDPNQPAGGWVVVYPGAIPVGTPFCFGDGTGAACPCGNPGASGNGCANSVQPAGARLAASGNASLLNDTLVLLGNGMPNSSALYFQGTSRLGGGSGIVFGDGLRCAGGTVVRLGTKANASGASVYPGAGDPSISVRGGVVSAGAVRTYQVWYRNAAAFCTASTFNLSNGLEITWGA